VTTVLPERAKQRRTLPDPADEPTITAGRAAAILKLSVRGVYLAAERGEVPAIRVGRSVRIPTARFLAKFGLVPGAASDA